ncbi:hypothetical protein KEJ45_05195 [Candidatus Bathyarchaeota archaeon]|nr:hypothetical protein [Candidatus Bathyarchaeota archaeon]
MANKGVIIMAVLWILQSVGRLCFAFLGGPEGMGQFLDVQISNLTSQVMFLMFLLLGVIGLFAAVSLLVKQKLGFWVTTSISIATIAFDVWGCTIQYTAAIGFVLPIISIIYLYARKSEILH